MNKSIPTLKLGIFLILFFQFSVLIAQFSVKADRPDATYRAGEQMNFIFSGAGGGTATYTIRYDRGQAPDITSGTVQAFGGQGAIPFTLNEPGFVFCYVTLNGQTSVAGAAFSPFEIDEYEPDPADFDEFWNGWKAKLAAVPMSPQVTPLFPDPNAQTKDFRISLGQIDGRRVYGYLSIPPGNGPFPAIITHSSFGGNANFCIPRPEIALEVGAISLSIWMHNTQPDIEDFNAYKPEVWGDKDRIYHRYGVLGLVRAMDFIESLPEYNGRDLGLFGVSEGGGMSMLAAAVDDRPTMVGASIFAMSEHTGFKYDRASGFPFFLLRGSTGWPPQIDPQAVEDTKYYDAMRAAKRIDVPFYGTTSYQDETVMPATNFSAFNKLKGSSVLVHKIDGVHLNPDEFFYGKFDFMRKHFNQGGQTGYFADAGRDIYNANGSVSLSGKIEQNGSESNSIPVQWELVSGPGQINFSNKTSRETQASFTAPGEYLIRFRATDKSMLAATNSYFTITDYIVVSTDSGSDLCATAGGDADGDGVCADYDCDDNNPNISQFGDACDDGNPTTTNDIIQADCSCLGTAGVPCATAGGDADGDGICAQFDCDDNNPDISVRGDACDDGNSNTENDIIQADCSCEGTPIAPPPSGNCDVTWDVNGLNIKIENLNAPVTAVKIFDAAFSEMFVCNVWTTDCGNEVSYDVPLAGKYILFIQTFPDWNEPAICDLFETVEVTGGVVTDPCENAGGDNDGDGVCANEDCNDFNANISAAGDVCDDRNPETVNDVIQEDCSCAGTLIPQSGCPVVWQLEGTNLLVSNIVGNPHDIKIYDENLAVMFHCNSDNNACGETISYDLPGSGVYFLQIQLWNGWSNKLCEEFEKITVGQAQRIFAFDLKTKKHKVHLSWTNNTGSENDYFEVQRSFDGVHFYTIDLVDGNTFENDPKFYQQIDNQPFAGENFYRIKLNYLDGTSEFSDIKKAHIDDLETFGLFPNPAQEQVHISLKGFYGKDVEIQLVDQLGQRVRTTKLEAVSENFHTLDLSNLQNGIHAIWVFADGHRPIGKKLIVNRSY